MSRQMSKPLVALTAVAGRMAAGQLSTRVTMARQDEFGRLATAFNEMADRLEDTITTLRRFIADAAHELHTPLTAVYTNLELAASERRDAQQQHFLHRAQDQLKRLVGLTDDLLDLSRLESSPMIVERKPVNLVVLIREMSELYASRAEQAGLAFEVNTPSQPVITSINEAQVRRALCNLLDNAIKFTPDGGRIQVGVRQDARGARLWVEDTGIGIPPDDLPYLFNRFRRAQNASAYPGSGLGLAIIKAIAEGHGGQVSVQSSTRGSCFSFQLPAEALC
jgi:two-component system sensor histidine kinase BaeS